MSTRDYIASEVSMSKDHWHHLEALIEFTVATLDKGAEITWNVVTYPYGKGLIDFNKVKLVHGNFEVISERVDWKASNLVDIHSYKEGQLLVSQQYEEYEVASTGSYILAANIQTIVDKFSDPDSMLFGMGFDLDSDSIETLATCEEEGFDDEILAAMAHELRKR
ncbi:TPA: hypothetical protein NJ311_003632 [Vibrio parahaemolyticus]|nr:hypothetical protein [Vibrio parahaemolyticus]